MVLARGAALAIPILMILSGVIIAPSAVLTTASAEPTPTFDVINVPGDNETIEEAYLWLADGGTIRVAPGVYGVSLYMSRAANIVSTGGPGSTTLRSRSPVGGTIISTSADCTVTGFKAEGNASSFFSCTNKAAHVALRDNIMVNCSVSSHTDGFIFEGNSMVGRPGYMASLYISGDAATIDDNMFGDRLKVQVHGKNITISNCDFDDAGVDIYGDRCKVDECTFHDSDEGRVYINKGNASVSNCTFQDMGTCVLSLGADAVFADDRFTNCTSGLDLRTTLFGSKVARNNFTDCLNPVTIYQQRDATVTGNGIWNRDPTTTEGQGISFYYGSRATVQGNAVSGTHSYGLHLDGDNFTVSGNRIKGTWSEYNSSNGIGSYLTDSEVTDNWAIGVAGNGMVVYGKRTEYRDNLVQGCNQTGIAVMGGSSGNQFLHNDLIGNYLSASDASPDETWDENLFSDYYGPDANLDGYGDVPYLITGGNQDARPRIYNAPPLLGKINLGIAPVTFPASSGDEGRYLLQDFDYYQGVGEKLARYFEEVSYGSVEVSVQVLREAGGEMFSLTQSSSVVKTWNVGDFSQKAMEAMDDHVDFRAYDYREDGGYGIVVLVSPFNFRPAGRESCFDGKPDFLGWMLTEEEVAVDAIYTFAQAFEGSSQSITQLAHEFSHFLGKLLVTSRYGAKNLEWSLPDEYEMGNLGYRDSIMGRYVSNSVERVHLDSYCKEWLGWLSYEDVGLGDEFDLAPLPSMPLNGHIKRYPYSVPAAGGGTSTGYFILELRDRYATGSDWDSQCTESRSVNVYQVETKAGQKDRINLVGRITTAGRSTVIADQKVAFTLVSWGSENAHVRVQEADLSRMTGATLQPRGNVLNDVKLDPTNLALYSSWPDTDLHAYSEGGLHVGMNYTTGEYEVGIPGAICSRDLTNGREFIYVNSSYDPRFVVDSSDTWRFLDEYPAHHQDTDGREEVGVEVGVYAKDGELYSSGMELRELSADQEYEVPYQATENQDGSYSVDITDVGLFLVTVVRTGLPPNTEWRVIVDGTEHSTFISFMEMTLSEGAHIFTVEEVGSYSPSPSSGTITVTGSGTNLTIAFTKTGGILPGLDLDMDALLLIGAGLLAVAVIVAVALAARSRRRRRR